MQLPFTHEQFLHVFSDYNTVMWPVALLLWLATAGVMWAFYRRRAEVSRAVTLLLAVHWAWSGVVYHLVYFRSINRAAVLFGGLFIFQALLFAWLGLGARRLRFDPSSAWGRVGALLVIYALAYPALDLLFGLEYPALPLFAVPCPTTILTAGVLLSAPAQQARWAAVIPLLWAVVGGSAAFVLAIHADQALVFAGVVLLAYIARRSGGYRAATARTTL